MHIVSNTYTRQVVIPSLHNHSAHYLFFGACRRTMRNYGRGLALPILVRFLRLFKFGSNRRKTSTQPNETLELPMLARIEKKSR